ncbi:MAG: hypothetical protein INR73_26310 [Williamsia sp.]|nr:hypothetical protein [Williamsia sp.]
MKKGSGFVIFLAALSIVAGYLLSKVSIVGRMGMKIFYKEYLFLRSWWKDTLLLFVVLIILFALHGYIRQKLPKNRSNKIFIISCVLAIAGLYVCYDDFRHTISHHLLGERFHIGVYLFWIGWMATSLYYIVQNGLDERLPSGELQHKKNPGETGTT